MRKTLQAILVLAAAAAPALAGTLYIPVVAPDGDGGQKVVLSFTNNDPTTPRRFSGYLLGIATDGVAVPRSASLVREVQPLQTILVELDAKQVSSLLEVNAAPQIDVSARLENVQLAGNERLSVPLPVVFSENMIPAGTRQTLQGLRRGSDGTRSNFAVMNVGQSEARCTIQVFGASGQSFGSALLSLAPLSMAHYSDVLGLLGITSIADARASLECDQATFPWLEVYNGNSGSFRYLHAAASGKSTLQLPGNGDGGGGGGGGGGGDVDDDPVSPNSVLFVQQGDFHTPAPHNDTWVQNIEVGQNVSFDRVTIDFDVTVGPWSYEPHKLHSLFWLHRGRWLQSPWKKNIYGFANLLGPNKNEMKLTSNVDNPPGVMNAWNSGAAVSQGTTYHVSYLWDAQSRVVRLTLTNKATGQLVSQITGSTFGRALKSDDSGAFMIYFGHEDTGPRSHCDCGADRPTWDWTYSNLRLEFVR